MDGTKSAALPLIRHDLALSYGQIGLLASVPLIVGSVAELPAGILAGSGARRLRVILAGGLLFIAALALAATAASFLTLVVALVLFFPASGAFVSLTQSALMDADPARQPQLMARWALAGSAGAVLGPLLLAAVLAAGGSWRGAYLLLSGAAAAAWLGAAGTGLPGRPAGRGQLHPATAPRPGQTAADRGERPAGPAGPGTGLRHVVARACSVVSSVRRGHAVRWLALLQVADLLTDVLTGFVALYLVDVVHATAAQAALGIAVRLAAGLAADAAVVPAADQLSSTTLLRASAAAAAVLYPAFLVVPGLGLKLVLLALLTAATSPWYTIMQAELYRSLPGQSGLVVSLSSAAALIGALGPLAVGFAAARWGLAWALAGLIAVPVTVLLAARPSSRPPLSASPAAHGPRRSPQLAEIPKRDPQLDSPAVTTSGNGVRVRFAPSPTGVLHVGSARSALHNWVVALQQGGTLVLRIEDTDTSRNRPEWTEGIIRSLAWLGIDGSQYEGPFYQSGNLAEHQAAAERLFAAGQVYYCDCTRQDVLARTGDPHRGYDGYCRDRGLRPAPGRALRFRTPDEGTTVVDDLVRGKTSFENAALEDFVIARGDGSVLFLLANVVDDMIQRITLVIRAEEHLSNTPKQQLLWEALGHEPPAWAHVPIIVNEKRQKLSKRRDKVALEDFRDEGYLASAMRNYLMLLGWAPRGDREIVPWETIVAEFRLEDVNPSPAFFDVRKLRAFNGEYIRALPPEEFIAACQPWLQSPAAPWPAERFDPAVFGELAPLAQTRVTVLAEIIPMVDFAFLPEPAMDEASWAKAMKEPAAQILAAAAEEFAAAPWRADDLRERLEAIAARFGLSLGKAQAPVRVAVTGRTVGLPLFESLQVLGRDETLRRLQAASSRLASGN